MEPYTKEGLERIAREQQKANPDAVKAGNAWLMFDL